MRFFRDLRVARKLGILVVLFLVVMALLGSGSYAKAVQVSQINRHRAAVDGVARQLALLDRQAGAVETAQRDGLLATTDQARQQARVMLEQIRPVIDQSWSDVTAATAGTDLGSTVGSLQTAYTAYLHEVDGTLPALLAADPGTPAAGRLLQAEADRAQRLHDMIATARAAAEQEQTAADNQLENAVRANKEVFAGVAFAFFAIVISVAIAITRSITRPLQAVESTLTAMAGGDLRVRCPLRSADEVGRMAAALNQTVDQTQRTIHGIREVAFQLSSSSEELASASDQVSSRLSTIALATRELLDSGNHIAANTEQAAQVASSTVELGSSVHDLVTELSSSAQAITVIIDLIRGIARQTNLLALNATIEAARAGTHGKGFAVVASEVKDLANASSSATDSVQSQIESIQRDAARASSAIDDIGRVIGTIHQSQQTIATAVELQTQSTSDMSNQLDQIAAVTNAIASGNDTTIHTTSAADLARMATQLKVLVQHFQTD